MDVKYLRRINSMRVDIEKVIKECKKEAPLGSCYYCQCNAVECAECVAELLLARYGGKLDRA